MCTMKMHKRSVVSSLAAALCVCASVAAGEVREPTLWADVPDVSMCRKGGKYFMVSTTMHFNPGIPVMVSQDLVNWKMASYCYQTVENRPCDRLENGENDYAFGTFASSIRYNESDGYFYVISVNVRIDDTYLFRTKDPEKGGWEFHRLKKNQYDASIWVEDGRFWVFATVPGKPYKVRLTEMKPDFSGFVDDGMITLDNVTDCVGGEGLGEGAQVMKRNGWYYIVNICWPAGNCRTVVVHRSRSMQGPWEGRVVFQHAGIAQGSFIDTPDGKWYAYLFGDRGAVGRCPYILPMTWNDDWPVISEESLPHASGRPGIVSADDFASESLSLVWQWNHNPADGLWSLADRRGWLRLRTDRVDGDLLSARNTLTQRCWGPTCSAAAKIDISGLANGDNAGIALFQRDYVSLSATKENGTSYLVLRRAEDGNVGEVARVQVSPCARTVWVRAYGDFTRESEKDKLWNFPGRDEGWFAYSTDGKSWTPIGGKFHLEYTAPHFTGYRFALYMYSTLKSGGHADFDWFRIK